MRSPEAKTQTIPSSESHRHSIGETPLFEQLKLEYLKNQGDSDIEPVVSKNGAAISMLLEGAGSESARDTYKEIWATVPDGLNESDVQVYLEQSYQIAKNEDATFLRPAAIYALDNKTVWNASAQKGTTGLALVSDSDSIRLGSEATTGIIEGPLPDGYKLVMADNTLFDQLDQNKALTLENVTRLDDNGERDLYPFYSAVLIDSDNLYVGDKNPKHRMSEGQQDAVARTVAARRQAVRKKFGLPVDATDEQLKEAKKANRLKRQDMPAEDDHNNDADAVAQTPDSEAFTVTNKRVRSRKELLFASLDQLNSDLPIDRPAPEVTGPVIPPKPNYEPTAHLKTAADSEQDQSPDMSTTVEKSGWKDNLRHPLAYLASRLDAARVIHQNKLEERYTEDQLAERNKKQEDGIKIALGAVGVALLVVAAYKLGSYELHGNAGPSTVPLDNGRNSTDPSPIVDAAAEKARQIAAQHAEILHSPVQIIPNGGGGEAYTLANGADPSIWYKNQDEFMRLFPHEGYRMLDGNVGFSHPGELSDAAKEYWAKKFGKWL